MRFRLGLLAASVVSCCWGQALADSVSAITWVLPRDRGETVIIQVTQETPVRQYNVCQKTGPATKIDVDDRTIPRVDLQVGGCAQVTAVATVYIERANDTSSSEATGTFEVVASP